MTVSRHIVLVQEWEESERGWGVRPDGCSLHVSEEDRRLHIRLYYARLPDHAPDSYSRVTGSPYFAIVNDDVYKRIVEAKPAGGISLSPRERDNLGIRRATPEEIVSMFEK